MLRAPSPTDPAPTALAADRQQRLHALRRQLRQAFGAAGEALPVGTLPTGLCELDTLLAGGGLPRARLTLLAGAGATSLAHQLAAAATQTGSVLWVDGPGHLYPPALAAAGAELAEVAIVRPPRHGTPALRPHRSCRAGCGRGRCDTTRTA